MARRQHFLPRFLLKGFAHRANGDEHYLYLFRRGEPPREVNVKNVAVVGNFYGASGESNVDDILTRREGVYAPLVERLRRGQVAPQDKELIDELVTHLIVRTKNVQEAVAHTGRAALQAFGRSLSAGRNRNVIRDDAKRNVLAHPDVKRRLAGLPRGKRRQAIAMLEKRLAGLDPREFFEPLRQELASLDLAGIAADAQRTALGRLAEARVAGGALTGFHWRIVSASAEGFILGEFGPLAQFRGEPRAPIHGGDPLQALLLPVSAQQLLVGTPGDFDLSIDAGVLNRASAEYSGEFVVGAQDTERERGYQALIGRRALNEPDWIDEAVRRTFDRAGSGGSVGDPQDGR